MEFIRGGYMVTSDGTLFPDALDELAGACRHRKIPFHYVVLRCDLATCVKRAMGRDGERSDGEQCADLHARFQTWSRRRVAGDERAYRARSAADASCGLLD